MLLQNGQPKSLPNIVRQKMAKKPQRVLLKLSGEALMGVEDFGFDANHCLKLLHRNQVFLTHA